MPISEVKTRLPELVSSVEERKEEIVVTRNGKPAAVLVNYNEYERLKAKFTNSWRTDSAVSESVVVCCKEEINP